MIVLLNAYGTRIRERKTEQEREGRNQLGCIEDGSPATLREEETGNDREKRRNI